MFPDLFELMNSAFPQIRPSKVFSRIPTIQKVIDKNPTTVVHFTDGSKSTVTLSENDTYNLETAILYALVKRIYGKVDPVTKEARCPSLGKTFKKITESMTYHASKCLPKSKISKKIPLITSPAVPAVPANPKKAEKTSEKTSRIPSVEEFFGNPSAAKLPAKKTTGKNKSKISLKIADLDSFKKFPLPPVSKRSFSKTYTLSNSGENYTRPSKPFSQFTQEEKRAYWRFQKAKSRK